MSQDFVEAK